MKKQIYIPFEFPAGDYVIGDPCYTVPDEHWEPLLSSCNFFQDNPIGVTPDGVFVVSFGTAWGDGVYEDGDGNRYPVDAGMIGLISVSQMDDAGWNDYLDRHDLKRMVRFDRPFKCWTDGVVLNFGYVAIDTDPEFDDEDEVE